MPMFKTLIQRDKENIRLFQLVIKNVGADLIRLLVAISEIGIFDFFVDMQPWEVEEYVNHDFEARSFYRSILSIFRSTSSF